MKHYNLFFVIILVLIFNIFLSIESKAQTYPGNKTLASDIDIIAFGANYTDITGNLTIQESTPGSITGLSPLSTLTSVGGYLYIQNNSALISLSGLNNIATVGGNLNILNNTALTSLNGLDALTSVGGIYVRYCKALTSLNGLDVLSSVGSIGVVIGENSKLTSLNGLDALTSVGGIININNNLALASLTGLGALTSVGGDLYVHTNAALTEFCSLFQLLNGGGLVGSYNIFSNASNPLQQEIIDGGACTPLPVELKTFTASVLEHNVELIWETATEVNNYGFEVERKILKQVQNDSWEKVSFVVGHGNSNSPKYYSFTDKSIQASGQYLYRLKQIDIDGTFEYSDEVEINLGSPNNFDLAQNYPNPFNPSTVIEYNLPLNEKRETSNVKLVVYDILGNEVVTLVNKEQPAGTYKIDFDASGLSNGIYFYKLETDNYTASKKMILLK